MQSSHFQLFGLPARFSIDRQSLDEARQRLLAVSHPDRFAQGSDAQRRVALQMTARINEAHQTLQNPVARAAYLLSLHGIDLEVESNTRMPIDFLQEQMAWREALDEARDAEGDDRALALNGLRQTCAQAFEDRLARLGQLLDADQADVSTWAAAAGEVRALMFIEKFRSEIG